MQVQLYYGRNIILFVSYGVVRRKTLPFNRFTIVGQKTELLTTDKLENIVVYEPIRKYNKLESNKLMTITFGLGSSKEWDEVVTIINIVRPNTLLATNSIDKCKYYKRVEWNEKLDEYIY